MKPPSMASFLPFQSGLAQQGIPEWVWGQSEMLLSLLDMLLHTRTGGEVAKFKREKWCPLPWPTRSPSHPSLSFPRRPSPCTWGTRGTRKGFKVPAGLSEDMVEPRQGPLVQAELVWSPWWEATQADLPLAWLYLFL